MRLVCPNCSAQYEVDAAVIPDEGRDVLCSNCGHAWFQQSERQLAADAADEQSEVMDDEAPAPAEATAAPEDAIPADAPVSAAGHLEPDAPETIPATADRAAEAAAMTATSVRAAADETAATMPAVPLESLPEDHTPTHSALPEGVGMMGVDVEDLGADDFKGDGAEATPAGMAATPRRTLDDDMLSVLREEAAREAEARRAEGTSIEMQPELGLPESEPPQPTIESVGAATVRALRRRDEALAEEDDAEAEPPAPVNRKALLPDIEEINSTLTATSERRDLPAHLDDLDRRRSRSGFRAGFSVSFLIALALLLLYVTAPRLSQSLPALAPALDRYVASVDAGRIWLDARLRGPEATSAN